jgi:[lysine-biosynthesis-protein LysW]--L-2-aminoadipate ligase
MKVGILVSRIRVEEKMLLSALKKAGVEHSSLKVDQLPFSLLEGTLTDYDSILIRCLSYTQALYASRMLESWGITTVNTHQVIQTCGDKLLTTTALIEHGVPTLRTMVAFTPEAALQAIETLGYPAVLKPLHGSWGRLLAKINDRDAAEAILEHKGTLSSYLQKVFYIQEYVEKPGRDIRMLMIGDEVVYAIYRYSPHWITNTARGSKVELCPLTPELKELALRAARAIGVGVLALDIFETPNGLLVNEANHNAEFHGAMQVVGVDTAGKIVDYLLQGCPAPSLCRA